MAGKNQFFFQITRIDSVHELHFSSQIFCRVYDPEGTDRVSEELLVTGFQTVLVRPEAVTDLHWHVLRRKAREFLAFVDPARKGYFTIADLEAACRGNLTFLQYCATLC